MTRRLILKTAQMLKVMRRHNLNGAADLAREIGMHRTTTWRVLTGKTWPSVDFADKVLDAFPDSSFDDLFIDPQSPRRGTES